MGHDFRSKLTVSWRVSPVFRLKVVHGKLHGDITHVLWYHSSLLYMLLLLSSSSWLLWLLWLLWFVVVVVVVVVVVWLLWLLCFFVFFLWLWLWWLLLLLVVVVVVFTFFQSHTSLFDWTQHIHYHSLLICDHMWSPISPVAQWTPIWHTHCCSLNEVSMNRLWSFSPCALRCLGAKDQQAKHQSQIAHLHHVGQVLRERNHFAPRGPPSSRRTGSIESPYEGIHHGIVPVSFQLIHTDPHMSMLCNPISLWL